MKLTLTALRELRTIVDARDYHAEHGRYPEYPLGPAPDQSFDDWASDIVDDVFWTQWDRLGPDCPNCTAKTRGCTAEGPNCRHCDHCGWCGRTDD